MIHANQGLNHPDVFAIIAPKRRSLGKLLSRGCQPSVGLGLPLSAVGTAHSMLMNRAYGTQHLYL